METTKETEEILEKVGFHIKRMIPEIEAILALHDPKSDVVDIVVRKIFRGEENNGIRTIKCGYDVLYKSHLLTEYGRCFPIESSYSTIRKEDLKADSLQDNPTDVSSSKT